MFEKRREPETTVRVFKVRMHWKTRVILIMSASHRLVTKCKKLNWIKINYKLERNEKRKKKRKESQSKFRSYLFRKINVRTVGWHHKTWHLIHWFLSVCFNKLLYFYDIKMIKSKLAIARDFPEVKMTKTTFYREANSIYIYITNIHLTAPSELVDFLK